MLQKEDVPVPINDLSMLSEGDMSGNQHSIINSSPFAPQIGSGIKEKAKETVVVSFTPQQKEEALSELRKIAKGLAGGSSIFSRNISSKVEERSKERTCATISIDNKDLSPLISSTSSIGESQPDAHVSSTSALEGGRSLTNPHTVSDSSKDVALRESGPTSFSTSFIDSDSLHVSSTVLSRAVTLPDKEKGAEPINEQSTLSTGVASINQPSSIFSSSFTPQIDSEVKEKKKNAFAVNFSAPQLVHQT